MFIRSASISTIKAYSRTHCPSILRSTNVLRAPNTHTRLSNDLNAHRHNLFFFRASKTAARDKLHSHYPHGKDLHFRSGSQSIPLVARVSVRRWRSIADITLCSPGYLVPSLLRLCGPLWQKTKTNSIV